MARPALRVATPPPARERTARFVRVTVANFFFFMNFASFFLLPLHVRALGGSERTIGLVMGTTGMAGLLVIPALAILLDRLARRGFPPPPVSPHGVSSGAPPPPPATRPRLLCVLLAAGRRFSP